MGATGRSRAATALVEIALTIGALLGVAVMGVTITAARTDMRTLVVRSGSMEPTIPTGSMVLVRRIGAHQIKVGDIVAVERPDHTRVTHRVVALQPRGDSVELTLKGDANEDPDPAPVAVRHADRVVWHAPGIGRVMAWLATAQGGFVVGVILTAAAMQFLRGRFASRKRRGASPGTGSAPPAHAA